MYFIHYFIDLPLSFEAYNLHSHNLFLISEKFIVFLLKFEFLESQTHCILIHLGSFTCTFSFVPSSQPEYSLIFHGYLLYFKVSNHILRILWASSIYVAPLLQVLNFIVYSFQINGFRRPVIYMLDRLIRWLLFITYFYFIFPKNNANADFDVKFIFFHLEKKSFLKIYLIIPNHAWSKFNFYCSLQSGFSVYFAREVNSFLNFVGFSHISINLVNKLLYRKSC